MVYIVKRGNAVVSTKDGGKVADVSVGAIFGELALLGKKGKRSATVTAKGPGEVRLLCLNTEVVKQNSNLDEWRKTLEKDVGETFKAFQAQNEQAAGTRVQHRHLSYTTPHIITSRHSCLLCSTHPSPPSLLF